MLLLLWSLLALVLAPLLYRIALRVRFAVDALDGFVLVAIGGIVLMHIVPHSVEAAGWTALVVALAGLLGPGMTERLVARAARPAHTLALLLAVAAVALHAFLDGAALKSSAMLSDRQGLTFALAVILHRLPEGLTIWWLLRPRWGAAIASLVLGLVAVSTTGGFFGGEVVLWEATTRWLALLQALVAGSLLHVVIHRPHLPNHEHHRIRKRYEPAAGVGGLLAVALLVGIFGSHPHFGGNLEGAGDTFVLLALESAPLLVLAYLMSGLAHAFLPRAWVEWMGRGSRLSEAFRGVAIGMPLPVCSCGAIPLYRSLIGRGVPTVAALAFLVAAPEIGFDAVLLSIPLLGTHIAIARLVGAFVVALLAAMMVGSIAGRSPKTQPAAVAEDGQAPTSIPFKLKEALAHGLGKVVDETGPWILVGLAVAAVAEPLLQADWVAHIPRGADVPLMAVLGMPLYVCASGATPFVAVLVHKGISPGAALAFLFTGPATNVTTFGVLTRLHGLRVAVSFGTAVAALSIGLGYLVNAILPPVGKVAAFSSEHAPTGWVNVLGVVALAILFALSLVRQGPRGFLGQVTSLWGREHEEDICDDCACESHGVVSTAR